jgi:DNA-binding CsgD family transcriptional regulator
MAGPVSSSVFVGREQELSVLEAALARAESREGTVVLLAGESGMGKSRLIGELSDRARRRGATVLTGECLELAEGELPYAPIVGALRSLVRERGPEVFGAAHSELSRLMPELAPADAEASSEAGSQARLFEQLLGVLSALGQDGPVLLVVEDLHWADRSTRDFISFLVRNARRERIALVASYRSDELHRRHPLRPFVLELERSGQALRIELRPFTRAELSQQVAAIRGAAADPTLVEDLLERSDGNPFFTEELLAASSSSGAGLPQSLRDALLLRVEGLSDAAQSLLRVAAVAGRTIDHSLLAVAADLPDHELNDGLRQAVAGYVLVHDSESTGYSFRHALLREAVYEDLLPGERRMLHISLAKALEERPELAGSRAAAAAELAHHWRGAHELPRALPASIRAGMEAEAVRALAEASLHYQRALEIWDVAADAAGELPLDRIEVTRRAAEAESLAGDRDRSIALARSVLEQIDEREDPVAAALAHERLGRYLWLIGRGEDAVPVYQRAVELMPAEPPSEDRAFVLAGLAQVLMLCIRNDESAPLCEAAVEIARSVGARAVEAHALNTMSANLSNQGDRERAVQSAKDALAIALEFELVEQIGRSYVNGADALDQAGRIDESIAFAKEGVEAARKFGAERGYGDFLRAEIIGRLYRAARWDEAEKLLADLVDRSPSGVTECLARQHLAELHSERGELEDAAREAKRARELTLRSGGSMWHGPISATQASIELWAGRPEAAAALIDECLELVAGTEYLFPMGDVYEIGVRAAADIAAAAPGDEAVRERQLEHAQGLIERFDSLLDSVAGTPPQRAPACRATCAAELTRITGEPGADLWAEAQRLWEVAGDPYEAARAGWRRAEALLTEGGDRGEAERLVREAHSVAEKLRAAPLRKELEALARRARFELGPAGTPSEIDRLDLTPRELEVLGLLALGRTNRDIAGELFISEKTASVHVSRILSKLGARNRAEAAAIAHRLGLQPEPA